MAKRKRHAVEFKIPPKQPCPHCGCRIVRDPRGRSHIRIARWRPVESETVQGYCLECKRAWTEAVPR